VWKVLTSDRYCCSDPRQQARRLADDLFLEFRYDDLTSTVAVMTVQSPHNPWTISEKTLDSTLVRMAGAPLKGESTIRTPTLTIKCQKLQGD